MDYLKLRRRAKRDRPNKKWAEEEIKLILNYLQKSQEIEAPTAQIFYKKLIEKTGINASWDLLRWKVRHLKASYKKANDWRKSTGAELLESDAEASSIEGKVLQICPHYKQLNEIFVKKTGGESDCMVIDSEENTTMDVKPNKPQIDELQESPNDINDNTIMNEKPSRTQIEAIEELTIDVPCDVLTDMENSSSMKQKKFAPKSSSAYLAAYQTERTALFKLKFEWEKEKHKKELLLNERKLILEEEKTKAELDLKKQELELKRLEIEKDAELRILEIERDERLKRYEIEMKYKKP